MPRPLTLALRQRPRAGLWAISTATLALAAANPAHALTISASFDPTITKSADAKAIEAAITQSIKFFETTYSNDVMVKIFFRLGDVKLAQTESTDYGKSYAIYTGTLLPDDLKNNPRNKVLATAIPNLKWGNKPQQGSFVFETSADFRALGVKTSVGLLGENGEVGQGDYDGVITLTNMTVNAGDAKVSKIAYGGKVLPNQYAANSVIQHEIDEVLGIGHDGSLVGNIDKHYKGGIGGLDLYRYKAEHEPSFSTLRDAKAYFSIDGGKTPLIDFNQVITNDTGDWADIPCDKPQYVQVAFTCPGPSQASLTLAEDSVESIALQSIGYNLVPEPAAWILMFVGFGGVGARLRAGAAKSRRLC